MHPLPNQEGFVGIKRVGAYHLFQEAQHTILIRRRKGAQVFR